MPDKVHRRVSFAAAVPEFRNVAALSIGQAQFSLIAGWRAYYLRWRANVSNQLILSALRRVSLDDIPGYSLTCFQQFSLTIIDRDQLSAAVHTSRYITLFVHLSLTLLPEINFQSCQFSTMYKCRLKSILWIMTVTNSGAALKYLSVQPLQYGSRNQRHKFSIM